MIAESQPLLRPATIAVSIPAEATIPIQELASVIPMKLLPADLRQLVSEYLPIDETARSILSTPYPDRDIRAKVIRFMSNLVDVHPTETPFFPKKLLNEAEKQDVCITELYSQYRWAFILLQLTKTVNPSAEEIALFRDAISNIAENESVRSLSLLYENYLNDYPPLIDGAEFFLNPLCIASIFRLPLSSKSLLYLYYPKEAFVQNLDSDHKSIAFSKLLEKQIAQIEEIKLKGSFYFTLAFLFIADITLLVWSTLTYFKSDLKLLSFYYANINGTRISKTINCHNSDCWPNISAIFNISASNIASIASICGGNYDVCDNNKPFLPHDAGSNITFIGSCWANTAIGIASTWVFSMTSAISVVIFAALAFYLCFSFSKKYPNRYKVDDPGKYRSVQDVSALASIGLLANTTAHCITNMEILAHRRESLQLIQLKNLIAQHHQNKEGLVQSREFPIPEQMLDDANRFFVTNNDKHFSTDADFYKELSAFFASEGKMSSASLASLYDCFSKIELKLTEMRQNHDLSDSIDQAVNSIKTNANALFNLSKRFYRSTEEFTAFIIFLVTEKKINPSIIIDKNIVHGYLLKNSANKDKITTFSTLLTEYASEDPRMENFLDKLQKTLTERCQSSLTCS